MYFSQTKHNVYVTFFAYSHPSYAPLINTIRFEQNGPHFADGIFKFTFLNENIGNWIAFSLKCVPQSVMLS